MRWQEVGEGEFWTLGPDAAVRINFVTQTLEILLANGEMVKCSQGEGVSLATVEKRYLKARNGSERNPQTAGGAGRHLRDAIDGVCNGVRAWLNGEPPPRDYADLDDGRAG